MRTVGSSSTIKTVSPAFARVGSAGLTSGSSSSAASHSPREVNAHGWCRHPARSDPHLAAGLLGETIDHRKPKASALADGLGREKRLEGARHDIGRHARAGVGYADRDILARLHVALARAAVIDTDVGGLDGELAAVGHGVAGIDAQVEDRVLKLVRIAQARPEAGHERRLDLDPRPDCALDQLLHVGDQLVGTDPLWDRASGGARRQAADASAQPPATAAP